MVVNASNLINMFQLWYMFLALHVQWLTRLLVESWS